MTSLQVKLQILASHKLHQTSAAGGCVRLWEEGAENLEDFSIAWHAMDKKVLDKHCHMQLPLAGSIKA